MSDPLRPISFDTYIGQPALIARLRILVSAAKSRCEPMPHTLLHGPPGLGKTTLAYIIANEMGVKAHIAMGPALEKPADVVAALSPLGAGDLLFIDEIHSMNRGASELLYPAMEDGTLAVSMNGKTLICQMPPFTLVGATTQPGLLEAPLRDRFGLPLSLNYYSDADLATIATANADKLRLIHEAGALELLAARSRGTPRILNHLLRFARDFSTVEADGVLSVEVVRSSLKMQGIDELGLNEQDRQYLGLIINRYKGGPVGADALASTMGLKPDTLTGVVEPFLLQRGLIDRTRQGRRATEKATLHLAA